MAIKSKDIYKGGQKNRKVAKTITIVLIVLVAVVVSLFFGLRHYAVYDENGNATIVLPFLQSGSAPDAEESP